MRIQESAEQIKSKLSSLGFEDWKIYLILRITNHYEKALKYLRVLDWDTIKFDSIENCEFEQLEEPLDYCNVAASPPPNNENIVQISWIPNKEQITKDKIEPYQPTKREPIDQESLERIESLEESDESLFKLEKGVVKDQIYTIALDMGFGETKARWASETFNEVEKAVNYLIELTLGENEYIEEDKIDLNYQKDEEGEYFEINGSDYKRDINEEDKDFDINDEKKHNMGMGIDKEQSRAIWWIRPNQKETEEMANKFDEKYEPRNENSQIQFIPSYLNQPESGDLNKQNAKIQENEHPNVEGNSYGGWGAFLDYFKQYQELFVVNNEENKKEEEEKNGIGWHQEINAEREQYIDERWISAEPISIDGNYVEGTNREQIIDILSDIIPVKGLSEEAKTRLVEFVYEGEILFKDCVICYEIFQAKNILYKLPCGHIFHKECFIKYSERNENCPLDRKKI